MWWYRVFYYVFVSAVFLCIIHFAKQYLESIGIFINTTTTKPKTVIEKENNHYRELLEALKNSIPATNNTIAKIDVNTANNNIPIDFKSQKTYTEIVDSDLNDFINSL